jgi:hypothetical protein
VVLKTLSLSLSVKFASRSAESPTLLDENDPFERDESVEESIRILSLRLCPEYESFHQSEKPEKKKVTPRKQTKQISDFIFEIILIASRR